MTTLVTNTLLDAAGPPSLPRDADPSRGSGDDRMIENELAFAEYVAQFEQPPEPRVPKRQAVADSDTDSSGAGRARRLERTDDSGRTTQPDAAAGNLNVSQPSPVVAIPGLPGLETHSGAENADVTQNRTTQEHPNLPRAIGPEVNSNRPGLVPAQPLVVEQLVQESTPSDSTVAVSSSQATAEEGDPSQSNSARLTTDLSSSVVGENPRDIKLRDDASTRFGALTLESLESVETVESDPLGLDPPKRISSVLQSSGLEWNKLEQLKLKSTRPPAADLPSNVPDSESLSASPGEIADSLASLSSVLKLTPGTTTRDGGFQSTIDLPAAGALETEFMEGVPARLSVKLDSPEAGRIWLHVRESARGVHAVIVAGTEKAHQLLASQVDQVRRSVEAAGVGLAGLDLSQFGQEQRDTFPQRDGQRDLPPAAIPTEVMIAPERSKPTPTSLGQLNILA